MCSAVNLRDCLFGPFETLGADLYTRREGPRPIHGISVYEIVAALSKIDFTTHFVIRDDRILVDQKGLVLIGNLSEFGPDAERLARAARYPNRFEVEVQAGKTTIVEHKRDFSTRTVANVNEHVGLVVCGQADGLPGRPTMLFFYTTPTGLLGVTRFAVQTGLAEIPAPPGFPLSPIEALVPLDYLDGEALPALSDLGKVRVVCGSAEWDSKVKAWIVEDPLTAIRIVKQNGAVRGIYVGDRWIKQTDADLFHLLLFLCEQSAMNKWTTIEEAQLHLDIKVNPRRNTTVNARRIEVAGIVPLESKPDPLSGRRCYLVRATITTYESIK